MNRPTAVQATSLAATLVGAAGITGLVAGIELNREPHADIWSNAWLLTSLVLAVVAVVAVAAYFVASMFVREESKRKDVAAGNPGPEEGETREPAPGLRERKEVVGTRTDEPVAVSADNLRRRGHMDGRVRCKPG
jgi:hypothetical protein